MVALALVAAACGQKPGVRDEIALDDGAAPDRRVEVDGSTDPDPGSVDVPEDGDSGVAEEGDSADDGADQGDRAGDAGDDPESRGGEAGGDGAGSQRSAEEGGGSAGGDGSDSESAGAAEPQGSDRTGVNEDTIRIGAHAPVTGAAPLPAPAFEEASDLYYRWYSEAQGNQILGGRDVEVTFANDQYQPSTAAQACRQLAQSHFLLFGAGGTDQIQQCGRLSEQGRLPYFSAGVTEAGLDGLDWYFALSMTYRAQGELLAQYVGSQYGGQNVAAVVTDTDNFDDAVQGWESGIGSAGVEYYDTMRHPRGDTGWYNTFARELQQNDVDVVYVNMAPVDYLRFAQQAAEQGFEPQFVGVGITMGLNPLLESGCPDVDGGEFFSPFPGLDWARDNEPEFFQAADRFGVPADDIAFAIWAQGKQLVEIFDGYEERFGTDLTREDFRAYVEGASVASDVFPPLSFSPADHFGADQVHLLRANCDSQEHQTMATFESSF